MVAFLCLDLLNLSDRGARNSILTIGAHKGKDKLHIRLFYFKVLYDETVLGG